MLNQFSTLPRPLVMVLPAVLPAVQSALPLTPKSLRKLAVIGPYADSKLYTIA